jgi:branched-chain amino acid transport system permease protein
MESGLVLVVITNAVVLTAVYLLLALGLNIIFALNRIINMAHGALYTVGAYIGLALMMAGANYFVALVGTAVAMAVLALVIERPLIAPIRGRPLAYTLILTFGLWFVFEGAIKYFFGAQNRFYSLPDWMTRTIPMGEMMYPGNRLVVIGLAVVLLLAVWYFLSRTKMGRAIRAASNIPEMVSCLGINIRTIQVVTLMLGFALAGLAGAIASPMYVLLPEMGDHMVVVAFVVIVVGGLGSIRGSIYAAVLIGFVQALTEFFMPDLAMITIYIVMAVVLAIVPRGLLREGRYE